MGKTPAPDPRVGEAALQSASLGREYLEFMQGQSAIANDWARDDRARSMSVFQPMEDRLIREAGEYDSPERKQTAANEAIADVRQQTQLATDARQRTMSAMGVQPDSGRFRGDDRRADAATALASAGAGNIARRQVEATGETMRANVVNLGNKFAVNPATSLGLANGAASAGAQGAQAGYGQMGSLLNQDYQNRLSAHNSKMSSLGSLGGALGSLAGAFLIPSTKKVKTNKRPEMGILDAVKSMPVERWSYKPGAGDGKEHVGPYAEDFKKATGLGDGRTISIIDALGVNMGATKELAKKVDDLATKVGGKKEKVAA